MDFQTSVRTCFQKYVTFSGRASRSEFWWFTLFLVIGSFALTLVDIMLLGSETLSPLSSLFSLATFLPGLAVAVRRLHDRDRSGWWYLLILVPLIGIIVLIVWWASIGTDGPNRFGHDPLGNAPSDDDGDYATSSIPRAGH
ncbi:DUF805 domain-containing protein [Aliiroseovarius sp. PrR006]|uniref:DUF805 domain-containing protein n=1 Tax=Aliiroseovarius sp. PrR006 TaxID=2706883 RepID=UPI0013D2DFBF|nr:DUF805 domain-containing protein [Aliiroseovarius sp. PrR006]NDW53303.1 DUF805 domain-containing protein [Aliiroseovarius sp. PrR006]